MFGGKAVGGIEIEAMSHIDKPLSIALTVTRGKRAPYVVQPLADNTEALKAALDKAYKATTKAELRPLYQQAVALGASSYILTQLGAHGATLPEAD
jgi:hypothetical protein